MRIASIILFLLTLLSAYGGRINPEYLWIPSALTLAMPYFVIATLVVSVAWLCCGRWITAALGALTLFAAWGPITTAVPLHFSKKADDKERTFKLLTYNILHGDDQQDTLMRSGNRSFRYVLEQDADLVGLQEVIDIRDVEEVRKLYGEALGDSLFKKYPYYAGTSNCDIKVLSKYPVELVREDYAFSQYAVKMPWGKLNWINMHMVSFNLTNEERHVMSEMMSVKNTEAGLKEMKGSISEKLRNGFRHRAERVKSLREVIDGIDGPLIVSGDFNDVPESYAYRLLRGDDLRDAYVDTSFGPMVTYNRHGFWFHLDQILYRPDRLKALSVKKGGLNSSDHYPLTAEFEWEN